MDRNGHVDPVCFIVKRVAALIDRRVEETFRDIQAMDQLRALPEHRPRRMEDVAATLNNAPGRADDKNRTTCRWAQPNFPQK